MLTLKLKIKSISDSEFVRQICFDYTGLFYKLYNNAELIKDKGFIKETLAKFPLLDKSIYDFCATDVMMKLNQFETAQKKKQEQIQDIESYLYKTTFTNKHEEKKKYHLTNKLKHLKKTVNKNICFGTKYLLQEITKQAQSGNAELYNKYLTQFREKRKLGIYLVGRACEQGNRKIDFKLHDGTIIFKSDRKNKIKIYFFSSKKQDKTLNKLQDLVINNSIPLTTRIDEKYIYLSYDEERVSGFSFDESGYKKHLLDKKIKSVEQRKQAYKKFKQEQLARKLKNKISSRYISVDLNPKEISVIIGDKINDKGEFQTIYTELVSLKNLSHKLKLSSFDTNQVKQNNKRKYEISQAWKHIFDLCVHYNFGYFVMEELEFKDKAKNKNSNTEFHRQTKNLWHRTQTTNLITKYCNTLGIEKTEVNPVYSSFIGNMIYHNDYDPIASAKELLRRGIIKYIKGNDFFPSLEKINQEKMFYLLGENVSEERQEFGYTNWKELYKIISSNQNAKLRYRNLELEFLDSMAVNHLNNSRKSGVKIYS